MGNCKPLGNIYMVLAECSQILPYSGNLPWGRAHIFDPKGMAVVGDPCLWKYFHLLPLTEGWRLTPAKCGFSFSHDNNSQKKKQLLGFTSLPWIAGFKRVVWVCCDARGEGTLGLLGVRGSHVSVLAWHLTVQISYSETYLRELFSEYGESWRAEFFAFQVSHAFWRAPFDLWLQTGTTTLTNLTFPAFVLIP